MKYTYKLLILQILSPKFGHWLLKQTWEKETDQEQQQLAGFKPAIFGLKSTAMLQHLSYQSVIYRNRKIHPMDDSSNGIS